MPKIKTIRVWNADKTAPVIINEDDFDESCHALCDAVEEQAEPEPEPRDDSDLDDMKWPELRELCAQLNAGSPDNKTHAVELIIAARDASARDAATDQADG